MQQGVISCLPELRLLAGLRPQSLADKEPYQAKKLRRTEGGGREENSPPNKA